MKLIHGLILTISSFALANRQSSMPFISGDTFRSIANHIVDETHVPFSPDTVKTGDIIFLKTDYIPQFFKNIHPHITHPYILITHNSDLSPIYLAAKDHPKGPYDFSMYLDDSKIIHWFSQNIDYVHPKLSAIPIGIANPHYTHGNITMFSNATKSLPAFSSRKPLIYCNITPQTNPEERNAAIAHLKQQSCAFFATPKQPTAYLAEMKEYQFVVSPAGNGLDCHRAWEALLMGCIPIMKHSLIDPLFEGLPVILINEWSEITTEFIENKRAEFLLQSLNNDRAYASYWIEYIKNIQAMAQQSMS